MIETVEYKASHIDDMKLQKDQQYLASWLSPEQAKALEEGWAYTAIEDGVPLAIAGVIPMWQGRGMAWAYISSDAVNTKFIAVHKAVKRFLDGCYLNRIEMTVDCDFIQGHRWAKMLGFELEAERMRGYRPDGGDCALYARVRT